MACFRFTGTFEEFPAARSFLEAEALVLDAISTVDDTIMVWSSVDLTAYGAFELVPEPPVEVVVDPQVP